MTLEAPGAAVLRRSLRVTAAACTGFYALRYAAGLPAAALYALFAPIAIGLLSAVPGTGRRQAVVLLRVLPLAILLVVLGTLLAVNTWAATVGMLVLGFVLAFAAVGGPRVAGAAPGLQLFYILACFPPYAPEALAERLAGLAVGMLLLALAQILLPDPPPASYRERLAIALDTAARSIGAGGIAPDQLREAGSSLRLSRLPPSERPAGAGRTHRGLEQAGRSVRRMLDQLAAAADGPPADDEASAALLGKVAEACDSCTRMLRHGNGPPVSGALEQAMRGFQAERVRLISLPPEPFPAGRPSSEALRRQSTVLEIAESARAAEIAIGIAVNGRPENPPVPHDEFWYAEISTPRLWVRRILGNITLRSVLLQNAVRTALGLAAARLVAGSLDLEHGFWVLLAVLTLGRTTAGATWQAVRRALAGNAVGALAAGALLIGLGSHTDAYAALLVPVMLVGFSMGPMLGIACTQGMFTLVVATAFAQLAPVTWQLSEQRMIDVATGSAVGLLCVLLAWPAGARHEVRRAMADLLYACGSLVPQTAAALMIPAPLPPPMVRTMPSLHRLRLAEAAYTQFRSESGPATDADGPDWHAVLITAGLMLQGAHRLPRYGLRPASGPPGPAEDRVRSTAEALRSQASRISDRLLGDPAGPATMPDLGHTTSPRAVDLEVWMTDISRRLSRIEETATRPPAPPGPERDAHP
ncbi:FUSC family protein [Streptomyces sp. NPDC048305]|uniref:FUSC family protein n=1 Tax=Streptomyces sp. NPDC048305 TaxID=3365532 RepID=UPI00371B1DA5